MSDATPKLVETLIERLEQVDQKRLDTEAEQADFETQNEEKRLRIETRMIEAGQQVRELIVEHEEKLNSRKARRFGHRVIEMTLRDEPSLGDAFKRCREEAAGITEIKERMAVYKAVMAAHDPQSVITTPLLLAEQGPVAGPHRFEFGWKFALKDGKRKNTRNFHSTYAWRQSPLYIYRGAREIHSGEEADELSYIMLFPSDIYAQKEPELQSFTNGLRDDELAMTGKDAHLHALGLMQEVLKELNFKRSRQ